MFLAEVGKFVGGKVATAIIFLAVAAGGIWAWQHPETIKAFGNVVKLTFLWVLIAGALPWTSFVFIRPLLDLQSRMQNSNSAAVLSVAMIGAYLLLDVLLAFWLAGWNFTGGFTWFVVLLGFLAAGAYNFVICESLARRADS